MHTLDKNRNIVMRKYILCSLFAAVALQLCAQTPSYARYAGWHKQYGDTLRGANIAAALQYLAKQGIKPRRTVVVGILDSGIDTATVALKDALWVNRKERPGRKDCDGNGYAGDVHGWNFLGTADGTFDMTSAGTEEYREFKRLYPRYKHASDSAEAANPEYAYYRQMRKAAGINRYLLYYKATKAKMKVMERMDSALKTLPNVHTDTLRLASLARVPAPTTTWADDCQALLVDLMKAKEGTTWPAFVAQQHSAFRLMGQRIRGIEHDADKRLLMGDDMGDAADRFYGNARLTVEGCDHGTFVAGIIATKPDAAHRAYAGIFPEARLMIVRCVPDGDEYDKDVASAIRYAVDNGAKVINMSLGKYTSPQADMVNRAIAYAARKDVLIVQAAGNHHRDIDSVAYYPTATDAQGRRFDNFIRVGASDFAGHLSSLSNYGRNAVDVLAPGEYIASVLPGDVYDFSQGTSVAAPIVSSVAALLRSCFPKLSAKTVKAILVQSVRKDSDGLLDAEKAVRAARALCR
ncbi:peptidase, S8/S53 family [Prevotella sp. MSX73]|nr:peptidase, S8/S53 family [Prevotella sp. MSX73]